MLLGTVVGTSLGSGVGRTRVGVVEVDGTALDVLALHGVISLGGLLAVGEVDIAEALAAASVLVVDNTSTDETLEAREGLVQDVVVDAPAQAAGEEGAGGVGLLGLRLLGGSVGVIVRLALLGRRLLSLLGLGGIRIVAAVGVVRVFLIRGFLGRVSEVLVP